MKWMPAINADCTPVHRQENHQESPPLDTGRDLQLQKEKIYTMLNVEERRTRIQYRPDCLFVYNQGGRSVEQGSEAMKELTQQLQAARSTRFKGQLSGSAQKNMVRAFDNLMTASRRKQQFNKYLKKNVPFQLATITLTLPTDQKLSSKEMNKRLLKRFLQWLENYSMRTYRKKLLYLWKLELQERGQLHWHIILNKFIPWELVANFWSYLLKDAGLSRQYFMKFGSHNVKPATKVEAVKMNTAADLRNYMLKKYLKKAADKAIKTQIKKKYELHRDGKISKQELQLRVDEFRELCSQIDGSVWGCSDPLKEPYPSQEIDYATYRRLLDYSKANEKHFVHFEFCMIIRDEQRKPPDKLISPKFQAVIRCHKDLLLLGGSSALKNLN